MFCSRLLRRVIIVIIIIAVVVSAISLQKERGRERERTAKLSNNVDSQEIFLPRVFLCHATNLELPSTRTRYITCPRL